MKTPFTVKVAGVVLCLVAAMVWTVAIVLVASIISIPHAPTA